jgi:hypothetical protein
MRSGNLADVKRSALLGPVTEDRRFAPHLSGNCRIPRVCSVFRAMARQGLLKRIPIFANRVAEAF